MSLAEPALWLALAQVVGINAVLSVDNAVVVALALRTLPRERQRRAILWACVAIALSRIALTALAAELLELPYLRIAGALLLFWISVQLLRASDAGAPDQLPAGATLARAIGAIVIADTVMSIDNVVAVAGAAQGNLIALALGLAVSIPLIIVGAAGLARLVERFPVIVVIGAALIGSVAGGMLVTDPTIAHWIATNAAWLPTASKLIGAALVVVLGMAARARAARDVRAG